MPKARRVGVDMSRVAGAALRSGLTAVRDRSSTLWRHRLAVVAAALLLVTAAQAEDAKDAAGGEDSATKLAKQTQNPVANLISVPFQNDINFNTGTKDATQWVLNVQPVIPVPISDDWNLIARTIIPIVNQPELFSAGPRTEAFGMGDINPTFFLSPAKPGKFIWGVGPTLTLPTATVSRLGSGRWSAGPAAVGLFMNGPWVAGALVNQQWDFAGWSDKHVNAFLMQPFVNYNITHGWYVTSSPIITANWSASGDNHWTVPVGGGGGKLWRVGKVGLPVNTQLQAFYNAETPEFGPDWQLRAQVQVLFPR
jgi:hypothetical protein